MGGLGSADTRRETWGRRRSTDMREVINAILYGLRTGCQWDWLPHDFPPWWIVHQPPT